MLAQQREKMLSTPMEVMSDSESQDILSELRTFVAGASRSSDLDHNNLVKTSISLLKTLPAARESILEYFGSVFHNYVNRYLSLLEVLISFQVFVLCLI